jgi:polyprenyl-phospho-N-acetylgalactosaminyl synthase
VDKVFVVIPVYNEHLQVLEETVINLLREYAHLIIVDDGSSLACKEVLWHLQVTYLRHPVNLGQGAALQTGTDYALRQGAEIIVHFDADGQHNPLDIAPMLEVIRQGQAEVVLGSRFLREGDGQHIPFIRKMTLQGGRIINFLFTGIWLSDAHQGLRVMSRKAAMLIRFTENRQAHATEILSQIRKNKLSYQEMPVNVRYTTYSRSKGQGSLNAFNVMVDLVLNKIFR